MNYIHIALRNKEPYPRLFENIGKYWENTIRLVQVVSAASVSIAELRTRLCSDDSSLVYYLTINRFQTFIRFDITW